VFRNDPNVLVQNCVVLIHAFIMSNVWIPSDEEYNKMCCLCKNNSSNAFEIFKNWINRARQSRAVCKETFWPADWNKRRDTVIAPLALAADYSNTHIVKYLLTEYSSAIDVNTVDIRGNCVIGYTALWAACLKNNREIARLLLRAGADVNGVSHSSVTPMKIAANYGNCGMMELLRSYGADINMKNDEDFSPLMVAGAANQTSAVMFLLEHGVDVNQKNSKGLTVFHVAVHCSSLDVIRILISKGFLSNFFETPQLNITPCPYFFTTNDETTKELLETHSNLNRLKYMSESSLLIGASYIEVINDEIDQPLLQCILENWRTAVQLREKCGYVPKFLPPTDLYAGLSEFVTENDLDAPPLDGKIDMDTWVIYQSLLIKERIMGAPHMLRTLLASAIRICEKGMFKNAELLWLQFIEHYFSYDSGKFLCTSSIRPPRFRKCMEYCAQVICHMVKNQYQPDFSKFVQFGFTHLSKTPSADIYVFLESFLLIFVSWIYSEHSNGEACDCYSDKCEELGREFVTRYFHISDEATLLNLAFFIFYHNRHVVFGPYYQPLVFALLRWGCDQDLYSIRGSTHLIHEAVKIGNIHHIDIVTPLLNYGYSPLFVDSEGRTAIELATSDIVLHALRPYSLSLFSMCCVAIVKYGFPYESLELPNAVKNNIRLFDKSSRN